MLSFYTEYISALLSQRKPPCRAKLFDQEEKLYKLGSKYNRKRLYSIEVDRTCGNGECPRQVCVILDEFLPMT